MEGYLAGLEALPMPTLAVVEGFAIGGGLAIAACCDLRIATPGARFGVPIARTLGNCLSVANYARLVAALGASRAKRMLLLAENLSAEEALAGGLPQRDRRRAAELDPRIAELCDRLVHHAPITMRVSKEALRRLTHARAAGRRRSRSRVLWQRRLPHRRQSVRREARAAMDR